MWHETGMKIRRNLLRLHDADVRWQKAIDGFRKICDWNRAFSIKAGHVSECMHAAVRAACADDGEEARLRLQPWPGLRPCIRVTCRTDACIGLILGSARSSFCVQEDGLLREKLAEGPLKAALNGRHTAFRLLRARLLDLPAFIIRAIICDGQLDSSHILER